MNSTETIISMIAGTSEAGYAGPGYAPSYEDASDSMELLL